MLVEDARRATSMIEWIDTSDDYIEMNDFIDGEIVHETFVEDKPLHIRNNFLLLPCPCQPKIELYQGYVRVIHRRLQ